MKFAVINRSRCNSIGRIQSDLFFYFIILTQIVILKQFETIHNCFFVIYNFFIEYTQIANDLILTRNRRNNN